VENYIHNQVSNELLADQRFREMLASLTVVDPQVDLSLPTETNSGRYWYNLHLVLLTSARYRIGEEAMLVTIKETTLRICAKKGYRASTLAVLPDHLHLALRGAVEQSPEEIALSLLNNLAHVLDRQPLVDGGVLCRHLRGVQHGGCARGRIARELLHLPDKPAGVEVEGAGRGLAGELLHLPDKPEGVDGERAPVGV
jgi:hypothetical protein